MANYSGNFTQRLEQNKSGSTATSRSAGIFAFQRYSITASVHLGFKASKLPTFQANKMDSNKYILLTVDVEDWFQVENFKPWISFSTWNSHELRVERNVHRLLDLFDSCEVGEGLESLEAWRLEGEEAGGQEVEISPKTHQTSKLPGFKASRHPSLTASQPPTERRPQATFFVLGWIAEKLPQLIREIYSRGPEIASHGCNHNLSNRLSHEALSSELDDSRKILQDIISAPVIGFRSPSFSINSRVLEKIAESGYLYDSSFNSFSIHRRYGPLCLNGTPKCGIAYKISPN